MRVVAARMQANGAKIDATIIAQALKALETAPLEEEPFFLTGSGLYNVGRYQEADRLLDIARRRHPRSREVRYLAADTALANGEIVSAVEDLEVIRRLWPGRETISNEALVLLAGHPETGKAALAALQDEKTKSDVVVALARSGARPSELVQAIALTGAERALASNPSAINAITRPLIDARDYEGSYQVWSALQVNPPSSKVLVRDPGLSGAYPPPFGWEVRRSSDAFAEVGSEGLVGEFYGRRDVQIARQLLLLAPGTYRLAVDAAIANDSVSIAIVCANSPEILRVALETVGLSAGEFTVPTYCTAQWLEVKARASDPPRAGSFHVRSIRIGGGGA